MSFRYIMNAIVTIFLIFLAQCTYLYAAPAPIPDICDYDEKSLSMVQYTSNNRLGKNIGVQECCENLDKSKPITFLVHGFISTANVSEMYELASQLIENGHTVYSVEWSEAACRVGNEKFLLGYPLAVDNTPKIGAFAASYMQSLIKDCGVSIDQIRCIGHSLGAHICGFTAKKIQKSGHGTIPLIIAADPASPSFKDNKCEEMLCINDTLRLVVLHTATGGILPLGISKSMGNLDLYFNGGDSQPGCGWDLTRECSHRRAINYISSMLRNNCGFICVSRLPKGWFGRPTPPYPGPDEKNCIVLNSNILNKDDTKKGEYHVFVEDENSPYCTSKTLSCQQ